MRTSAPGTTAPEASTIVPLITPVVSCASTQEVNTKAATEADATTRRFMKHLTRKLERRITNCRQFVQGQSCLIQDEPGGEVCFSHKMSLKERIGMLGFDRQRANGTRGEP